MIQKYHEFHPTHDQMTTHFDYTKRQLLPAETQLKHRGKCLQSIHKWIHSLLLQLH
ncbi:hypothetical protein I79_001580 [Cricetulus griseus]|uniref:Uncharacterized protein n=1 Tax=Cricetulus griseus TaxID=10029 RepID=G3GV49_CRIGR|nr:hypothetical protein I79_001580 [Cricetulus griseus]